MMSNFTTASSGIWGQKVKTNQQLKEVSHSTLSSIINSLFNHHPHWGMVVASPCEFFSISFQLKVVKRLFVICTYPITHRFANMHRNFRVPYGKKESLKSLVAGGGVIKVHDSYLAITKIFDML